MYEAFFDLLDGLKTLDFVVDMEKDEIFDAFYKLCNELDIYLHEAILGRFVPRTESYHLAIRKFEERGYFEYVSGGKNATTH